VQIVFLVVAAAILPTRALSGEKEDKEDKEDKETLDEEFLALEDADFPDLVGVDEKGEVIDEFAFLEMEAVVETAARRPQPIFISPSAITLLNRQDIDATGARVLPEVLREVPGMDIYAINPFAFELGVRGADEAVGVDNVLLLVDGRDLTLEFFGFPMWAVQHFSLDDVKRIEVVRGPGSALYGANAYGGVVQVFTYEPGEGPEAFVSVRGGEHGQTEVNGRWSRNFGSFALAGSAGVVREDLWTGRDMAGRDAIRGRLDGKIELGAGSELWIDAGAYQTSGKMRSSITEGEFKDLTDYYTRARLQLGDLTIQAVYERTNLEADLGIKFVFEGLEIARVSLAEGYINKIGLMTQHSLEGPFRGNRLIYGIEYVYDQYHVDLYWDPDQFEHHMGVFLQDEIGLGGILREVSGVDIGFLVLTAGLRFDANYIKDWGWTDWELSPRAALVWAPVRNHSFRVGYAHAFLKPKFFEARLDIRLEDVMNQGFDRFRMDNSDLKNETIDSVEAGYAGSFFDGRLVFRLDFSYNWYRDGVIFYLREDEMDYRSIGSIRIPDITTGKGIGTENAADGYDGHNLELHVSIRPSDYTRVLLTVDYRQLFESDFESIEKGLPIWRLTSGLDLGKKDSWTASIRAYYTARLRSEVRETGNVFGERHRDWLPEKLLLNARFSWRLHGEPFGMSAGVEVFNMLGHRFRELQGLIFPNRPDYSSERLDRRIVLFLEGRM
jgi:outer membrane receptor protein involved in Fe transport